MTRSTQLILVITFAGCFAFPASKELVSSNSSDIETTVEKLVPIVSISNKDCETSKGLKKDCEDLCAVCNATGKLEEDGSCTCFSDNGGKVSCLRFPRYDKKLKLDTVLDPEKDKDSSRGQRCLGLLGSAKDDVAPAISLQTILGAGLVNLTAAERVAEIRKRVDSLRTITISNLRNALEKTPTLNIEPLKIPATLELPSLQKAPVIEALTVPKISGIKTPLEKTIPNNRTPFTIKTQIPLSPFIGKPLEGQLLGNRRTTYPNDEATNTKEEELVQAQNPIVVTKSARPSEEKLGFNLPRFNFGRQLPSLQARNQFFIPPGRVNLGFPTSSSGFSPLQLRGQLPYFNGFGQYGRALRSPGILFSDPIITASSTITQQPLRNHTDISPIEAQDKQLPANIKNSEASNSQGQNSSTQHSTSQDDSATDAQFSSNHIPPSTVKAIDLNEDLRKIVRKINKIKAEDKGSTEKAVVST